MAYSHLQIIHRERKSGYTGKVVDSFMNPAPPFCPTLPTARSMLKIGCSQQNKMYSGYPRSPATGGLMKWFHYHVILSSSLP